MRTHLHKVFGHTAARGVRQAFTQRYMATTLRASLVLSLLAIAALLGGCDRGANKPGGSGAEAKPIIAVTIHPLADVTRELVGDAAEVVTLIPPDRSPHGYELPAATLAKVKNAKLLICVGGGLDNAIEKAVVAMAKDVEVLHGHEMSKPGYEPKHKRGDTSHGKKDAHDDHAGGQGDGGHKEHDHAKHDHGDHGDHGEPGAKAKVGDHGDHEVADPHADHDHHDHADHGKSKSAPSKTEHEDDHKGHAHAGHHHGPENPHFWLAPKRMHRFVEALAHELPELLASEQSPGLPATVAERAKAFNDKLQAVIAKHEASLKQLKRRELVTFHNSFDLLAEELDMKVVAHLEPMVELRPGGEITPNRLAEVAKAVKEHSLRVIYAEPQFPSEAVDAIARQAGVKVLRLDPIGHPDREGYRTYLETMGSNLKALHEGQSID